MKRFLIVLMLAAGLSFTGFTAAHAQVMNREAEIFVTDTILPYKPRPLPMCPFCNKVFNKASKMKAHALTCPYRYCIEYTYDASGNRICRAVVWTVSPKVRKEEVKESTTLEP